MIKIDTNSKAAIDKLSSTFLIFLHKTLQIQLEVKVACQDSVCYSFTPVVEKKEQRPHRWNPTTCNYLMLQLGPLTHLACKPPRHKIRYLHTRQPAFCKSSCYARRAQWTPYLCHHWRRSSDDTLLPSEFMSHWNKDEKEKLTEWRLTSLTLLRTLNVIF